MDGRGIEGGGGARGEAVVRINSGSILGAAVWLRAGAGGSDCNPIVKFWASICGSRWRKMSVAENSMVVGLPESGSTVGDD